MKTYTLSMLATALFVGLTCCTTNELINEVAKAPQNKSTATKIRKIELPTPSSALFSPVSQTTMDTVLAKLQTDIDRSHSMLNEFNEGRNQRLTTVPASNVTYIPVIATSHQKLDSARFGRAPNNKVFEPKKDYVFFYETEGGKLIKAYYGKYSEVGDIYRDADGNITHASVRKGFGRLGDKFIEASGGDKFINKGVIRLNQIDASEKEKWNITILSEGDILFQKLAFALKQADNGEVFILNDGTTLVSYFRNNRMYYCILERTDGEIKEVDMDSKRFNFMYYVYKEKQDSLLKHNKNK